MKEELNEETTCCGKEGCDCGETNQPNPTLKEIQEKYINLYNTAIEEIKASESQEDLAEKEAKLISEFESYKEYIKIVEYELSDEITVSKEVAGDLITFSTDTGDTITYSAAEIADIIVDKISEREVEWKYTKGTFELCRDFKNAILDGKGISYYMYDSIIQLVMNAKYEGVCDFFNAMIIDKYLNVENTGYFEDNIRFDSLSRIHNAILDRQQELTTLQQVNS